MSFKKVISLVVGQLLACTVVLHAQEYVIKNFSENSLDLTARTVARVDSKGTPCALIKVTIPQFGVYFDCSENNVSFVVGDVSYEANEYRVYLSSGNDGAHGLSISFPNGKNLDISFSDYGIESLESQTTYNLVIDKIFSPYVFPVDSSDDIYIWTDAYDGRSVSEARKAAQQKFMSLFFPDTVESDAQSYVIFDETLNQYHAYYFVNVKKHIDSVYETYEKYMSITTETYTVLLGNYYKAFDLIAKDQVFRAYCPESDDMMKEAYLNIEILRQLHDHSVIWFGVRNKNNQVVMFSDVPRPFFDGTYEDIKEWYDKNKKERIKALYPDGSIVR